MDSDPWSGISIPIPINVLIEIYNVQNHNYMKTWNEISMYNLYTCM